MVVYPDLVLIQLLLGDEWIRSQEVTVLQNLVILHFGGESHVLKAVLVSLVNLSDGGLYVVGILTFDTFFIVSLAQNPAHFANKVKVDLVESKHYSL